ncbi:GBS Bsp-like repeat-containing protein [Acetobacterium sp.]|uniref:GBS Bsp-like repeat-containing protein n=1 Tax=Acetobacterium sp. TaxID=1872094 RepID=UPI000CC76B1B|nr:GBS Bsp-like repeat-containing protein [Acetobacterium sp.]MDO9493565.1 GBS Bsp-like repeat-containing protein [Acetobacterium sp.]PKM75653.1 MAG: hypothetical protein CVU92_00160 [Firmicutes bacterium HGW-Firmicutes-17]
MIKSTDKKSWIKPLAICGILILLFSSSQILAQEADESDNLVKEEVVINQPKINDPALESDLTPDQGQENSEAVKETPENMSDSKTNEDPNLITDDQKSVEESTEILAISLDLNNIKVIVTQVAENKNQFTISTVDYAGKTGIGKVLFPTWTERNGQDDLRWYEGMRDSNGEYSITIDNKDHGFETGAYQIHTYIYGLQGETLKVINNTFDLAESKPAISTSEVANNSYKVNITGISNNTGIISVVVPTWTQVNGHDDLRWETATYVGNDTWQAIINIGDYKQSYDTFISHVYVMDKNGQQKYAGATEKIIKNLFAEDPLEVSAQQDGDGSKFVIRTENCSGKPGIKRVDFAVWTNRNGQDEIKWYQGVLGANREYQTVVDIENHGFETGPFTIHTYLRENSGEVITISGSSFTMPKLNPTIEYDKAVLNNTFKMRIRNVGNENGVAGIIFPTWSSSNGQDDARWESATYIGNHTWEATINLQNYNIIVDEFISHAYLVDKNGKMVFAKDSSRKILQNTATIYGFFNYPLDKNYKPNPSDPTDWFGPRWGDIHEGVDIPAPYYAACYAVGNGIVEKAGYFMGYGRYVRIRTTDRYGESVSFFYGHLQEINVAVGQPVGMGQKIGSVGGSGYNAQRTYIDDAYGPHLHFGAIANADDACVNPEIWIDFHNSYSNAN